MNHGSTVHPLGRTPSVCPKLLLLRARVSRLRIQRDCGVRLARAPGQLRIILGLNVLSFGRDLPCLGHPQQE